MHTQTVHKYFLTEIRHTSNTTLSIDRDYLWVDAISRHALCLLFYEVVNLCKPNKVKDKFHKNKTRKRRMYSIMEMNNVSHRCEEHFECALIVCSINTIRHLCALKPAGVLFPMRSVRVFVFLIPIGLGQPHSVATRSDNILVTRISMRAMQARIYCR